MWRVVFAGAAVEGFHVRVPLVQPRPESFARARAGRTVQVQEIYAGHAAHSASAGRKKHLRSLVGVTRPEAVLLYAAALAAALCSRSSTRRIAMAAVTG